MAQRRLPASMMGANLRLIWKQGPVLLDRDKSDWCDAAIEADFHLQILDAMNEADLRFRFRSDEDQLLSEGIAHPLRRINLDQHPTDTELKKFYG